MKISGFIETSFVDWDSYISSVIFLPNCTLKCPFCHNGGLVTCPDKFEEVPFSKIRHFLNLNKGWVDGVCITGGEPTIHSDLPELCSKIKEMGFKVKLDTNGTNPEMLKQLVSEKLIDYVAMDVKAPIDEKKYFEAAGIDNRELFKKIQESITFLLSGPIDYEFRTTVVPGLHKREDIAELTSYIKNCKKYVIQNFRSGQCLDETFNNIKPFNDKELRQFKYAAQENIPKVLVRK